MSRQARDIAECVTVDWPHRILDQLVLPSVFSFRAEKVYYINCLRHYMVGWFPESQIAVVGL